MITADDLLLAAAEAGHTNGPHDFGLESAATIGDAIGDIAWPFPLTPDTIQAIGFGIIMGIQAHRNEMLYRKVN